VELSTEAALKRAVAFAKAQYRVGGDKDAESWTIGFDMTTKEEQARREKRAGRFGKVVESEPERMRKRREKFGHVDPSFLKLPTGCVCDPTHPDPAAPERPEAVHVYGTDSMSTRDILSIFSEYGPSHLEWINDSSCNIVWMDSESAARVVWVLGEPIKMGSDAPADAADEGTEKDDDADKEEAVEEKNDESGFSAGKPSAAGDNDGEAEAADDESLLLWRRVIGAKKPLLMRMATVADVKVVGAAKHSKYYKVHGKPKRKRMDNDTLIAMGIDPQHKKKKVAASMDDTLQNYMKAGGNKSEVQKEQKELAGLKQERSALIAKGGLMTKRQREKLEAEKAAKDGEGQDEDDADAAEAEPAKQSSRRGISRMRMHADDMEDDDAPKAPVPDRLLGRLGRLASRLG